MGIYIFEAIHGPYIKVGHYIKSNPYSRIAHRGFRSCIHPKDLGNRVMVDDMVLRRWFPSMNTKQEKLFHRRFKSFAVCGEWYPLSMFEQIARILQTESNHDGIPQSDVCDRDAALQTRRRL
jgi:hypothetical protein